MCKRVKHYLSPKRPFCWTRMSNSLHSKEGKFQQGTKACAASGRGRRRMSCEQWTIAKKLFSVIHFSWFLSCFDFLWNLRFCAVPLLFSACAACTMELQRDLKARSLCSDQQKMRPAYLILDFWTTTRWLGLLYGIWMILWMMIFWVPVERSSWDKLFDRKRSRSCLSSRSWHPPVRPRVKLSLQVEVFKFMWPE